MSIEVPATKSGFNLRFWLGFSLLTTSVVGIILLSGSSLSGIYLQKAKKTDNQIDRLRYFENSELFWHYREATLGAAGVFLEQKDYSNAAKYFAKDNDIDGIIGYSKAIYELGRYQDILDKNKLFGSVLSGKNDNLIFLSYMKLGRIVEARDILSKSTEIEDPESWAKVLNSDHSNAQGVETETVKPQVYRWVYSYNELNRRGFPQAAFELLSEGNKSGGLSRDALLALSQAQKDRGDSKGAFATLESALTKDSYYPQTYRQLVETGQSLGLDVSGYKSKLLQLTW
jgi:tetratricopeptide (TPR) repeat protein